MCLITVLGIMAILSVLFSTNYFKYKYHILLVI